MLAALPLHLNYQLSTIACLMEAYNNYLLSSTQPRCFVSHDLRSWFWHKEINVNPVCVKNLLSPTLSNPASYITSESINSIDRIWLPSFLSTLFCLSEHTDSTRLEIQCRDGELVRGKWVRGFKMAPNTETTKLQNVLKVNFILA